MSVLTLLTELLYFIKAEYVHFYCHYAGSVGKVSDYRATRIFAHEIIECFTGFHEDILSVLRKVCFAGLVDTNTDTRYGSPLDRAPCPFLLNQETGSRFRMRVDFRTSAITMSMRSGGPRKRYFYRDPALGDCISQYFADHHLALSE